MKRLMFATVGTASHSVESVAHSVRQYNPDHVVFLATEQARQQRVPAVVDRVGLVDEGADEPGRWTYSVPEDAEFDHRLDAERLYLAYRRLMRRTIDGRDALVDNAVADYSEGTRPMSAALFEAATSLGVPVVTYVTGERGDDGGVIPGTERTYAVHGRRLRAVESLDEAVERFNEGRYAVAAEIADRLSDTPEVFLPFDGQGRDLVAVAAETFEAWDRFQLAEALEIMQKLGDEDRFDPDFVAEHLMTTDEREAIRQRHLHQAVNREMYLGLLADVVANADRRLAEQSYDDAVGRLYRAIEYVAQLRIWERWELSTAEFPVDRLPDAIAGPDDEPGQTRPLAQADAWKLLCHEDDELGELYETLYEETDLRRALRKRNVSILAHGFEPVKATYAETLREAVDRLARAGWGDDRWEQLLEACRFPQIRDLRV